MEELFLSFFLQADPTKIGPCYSGPVLGSSVLGFITSRPAPRWKSFHKISKREKEPRRTKTARKERGGGREGKKREGKDNMARCMVTTYIRRSSCQSNFANLLCTKASGTLRIFCLTELICWPFPRFLMVILGFLGWICEMFMYGWNGDKTDCNKDQSWDWVG